MLTTQSVVHDSECHWEPDRNADTLNPTQVLLNQICILA